MDGKSKGGITGRGVGWELLNSWWVLFSFFALSWIGFFIVGKRARQKKWTIMGVIFCVLQLGLLFLPGDSNDIIMMIWFAAYIAGIIMSFSVRKKYLICRDVLLNARIPEKDDQQLRASIVQSYQKQGVQGARATVESNDMLTNKVRAAVQQGVPDEEAPKKRETAKPHQVSQAAVPQAAEQPEPLDINTCTEQDLSSLPGVSVVQAKKAVEYRRVQGGFTTVDEFFRAAALKPHFIVQLEGKLLCGPYQQGDAVTPQTDSVTDTAKTVPTAKPGRKLDF